MTDDMTPARWNPAALAIGCIFAVLTWAAFGWCVGAGIACVNRWLA